MSDIKGDTYQLAGFDFYLNGNDRSKSRLSVVFCGVNENPDSPKPVSIDNIIASGGDRSIYNPPRTVKVSAGDLLNTIVCFNERAGAEPDDYMRSAGANDVAQDLGIDNLRKVLDVIRDISFGTQCFKGDTEYFIPYSRIKLPAPE